MKCEKGMKFQTQNTVLAGRARPCLTSTMSQIQIGHSL
jgi:hypothetical protein